MRYFYLTFVIVFFTSCNIGSNYKVDSGQALGTYYIIKYDSKNEIKKEQFDSIFQVINNSLSTYHSSSIISKVNDNVEGVELNTHFVNVFDKSMDVYKSSKGYFDPTIGLLVKEYGFNGSKDFSVIEDSKLSEMLQYVGLDKFKIENNRLVKPEHGYIEFNALAKGYTLDVIGAYLDSLHVKNYLIDIGGENKAKGVNSYGKSWQIGIEDPVKSKNVDDRKFDLIVVLKDESIASSGNYRKFVTDQKTGEKYVHTINPKTGKAKASDMLSSTVIAKDCGEADGFATAFMAAGLDASLEILKDNKQIEAHFIYLDSNNELQSYSTQGFKDRLVN